MKILKTNIEELEKNVVMLYKLTKGNAKTVNRMTDEELDKDVPVDAYCIYEDVNTKGETVEIVSILSGTDVYAAQSAVIRRSFTDILDMLSEAGIPNARFIIRFFDGKTKSDRRYLNCRLVDLG